MRCRGLSDMCGYTILLLRPSALLSRRPHSHGSRSRRLKSATENNSENNSKRNCNNYNIKYCSGRGRQHLARGRAHLAQGRAHVRRRPSWSMARSPLQTPNWSVRAPTERAAWWHSCPDAPRTDNHVPIATGFRRTNTGNWESRNTCCRSLI